MVVGVRRLVGDDQQVVRRKFLGKLPGIRLTNTRKLAEKFLRFYHHSQKVKHIGFGFQLHDL